MSKSAILWLGQSLVVVAAATLLAACGHESSLGPTQAAADLTGCENLQAPAGSTLTYRAFAKGVQVYRWSGTAWTFVEPSAVLFAGTQAKDAVAIHYAGPTWLGVNGSKVVGAVIDRCTRNTNAIPWLLLGATPTNEPGVFQRTAFIQRVNTVGGNAPTTPGSVIGEVASVPYTADYLFYRAQ
jgi:hypothetical protein